MSLQMVKAWWYVLFSMSNDFTILSFPIALNRNYGAVTMEWFSFRLWKRNSKLSNIPSFLVYFQKNMSIYYIKMDVVVTFVLYYIIVLWNYFCALGHRVSFLYMIFETSFYLYVNIYDYTSLRIKASFFCNFYCSLIRDTQLHVTQRLPRLVRGSQFPSLRCRTQTRRPGSPRSCPPPGPRQRSGEYWWVSDHVTRASHLTSLAPSCDQDLRHLQCQAVSWVGGLNCHIPPLEITFRTKIRCLLIPWESSKHPS